MKSKATKRTGTVKATSLKTTFTVHPEVFTRAITRISGILGSTEGVSEKDQLLTVIASVPDAVLLESGVDGSYVSVKLSGCVVEEDKSFTTAIGIPDIKYGGKTVAFTFDPDTKTVRYTSKIRGNFVTSGKANARQHLPDETPTDVVSIDSKVLKNVMDSVFFDLELIGDDTEPLVKLEVKKVGKADAGKQIKRKKGEKKYEIQAMVHDNDRVITCSELCTAANVLPPLMLGVKRFKKFLDKTEESESEVRIGTGKDKTTWLWTDICTSVAPSVHGKLSDIDEILSNYKEDNALFSFNADAGEALETVSCLMSSYSESASSDKKKRPDIAIFAKPNGKVGLQIKSSTGTAYSGLKVENLTGEGVVHVEGRHLNKNLQMIKTGKLKVTAWGDLVRIIVEDRHNLVHYISTLVTSTTTTTSTAR